MGKLKGIWLFQNARGYDIILACIKIFLLEYRSSGYLFHTYTKTYVCCSMHWKWNVAKDLANDIGIFQHRNHHESVCPCDRRWKGSAEYWKSAQNHIKLVLGLVLEEI